MCLTETLVGSTVVCYRLSNLDIPSIVCTGEVLPTSYVCSYCSSIVCIGEVLLTSHACSYCSSAWFAGWMHSTSYFTTDTRSVSDHVLHCYRTFDRMKTQYMSRQLLHLKTPCTKEACEKPKASGAGLIWTNSRENSTDDSPSLPHKHKDKQTFCR